MNDPFYITTPIYYVNDVPHIGHAYTSLACDVLARFKRLQGRDVLFVTGTDEHGQKVEQAAQKRGMTAHQFVDSVAVQFQRLIPCLHLSPDDFIRTSEDRHSKSATALWQKIKQQGDIYLGHYKGWYATRDEMFVTESDIITDSTGRKKTSSGADVEWLEESSYFFRLSKWQEALLTHYRQNPDAIAPPSRYNEVIRFIESGLNDLSISRTSFSWGIRVPNDDKHIMYVWIDALANYLSVLDYPDWRQDKRRFWPAQLHMIGKDILRFHAVYWPALLLAADLPLPERIFAHGWWTHEGQKMSKSLGNVIDPFQLVKEWGVDVVRYFFMREIPFGMDGNFSRQAIRMRLNGDLANGIGNLAMRVLTLVHRYCDSMIPACHTEQWQEQDIELLERAENLYATITPQMDKQAFHLALESIWAVIAMADRYIDKQQPWVLQKHDHERMHVVLYVLLDVLRQMALVCLPFMPERMSMLCDSLALAKNKRHFGCWSRKHHRLVSGCRLPPPQALFPRLSS